MMHATVARIEDPRGAADPDGHQRLAGDLRGMESVKPEAAQVRRFAGGAVGEHQDRLMIFERLLDPLAQAPARRIGLAGNRLNDQVTQQPRDARLHESYVARVGQQDEAGEGSRENDGIKGPGAIGDQDRRSGIGQRSGKLQLHGLAGQGEDSANRQAGDACAAASVRQNRGQRAARPGERGPYRSAVTAIDHERGLHRTAISPVAEIAQRQGGDLDPRRAVRAAAPGGPDPWAPAGAALQASAAATDQAQRSLANRDFHRALYLGCGNSLIVKVLDDQRDQTARVSALSWQQAPSWEQEAAEHQAILAAAQAGDADRATTLLRAHIAGFAARHFAAPNPAITSTATTTDPSTAEWSTDAP